ncbi:hypothetical protein FRC09_011129 [Ceratobasidium sp. 395]|nr:hypothetical protein FRC09_011129 [Ceratobasidium sp. 395]
MALVPINKLPIEVLGSIFSIVQPYVCVHDVITKNPPQPSASQLVDISRVCMYWRKVAINTPELWTHIDLIVNEDHTLFDALHNRAKLWVERVRGRSSHLHMHELDSSSDVNIDRIEILSGSNLSRVVSVHLWSNSDTPFRGHVFPWELLGARNTYGPDPEIREIFIDSQSNHDDDDDDIDLPFVYISEKDYFYESVSVLHLRGVAVPWRSSIYHKLTELRLENLGDVVPSSSQIEAVLAASPGLRSLALCRMGLLWEIPNGRVPCLVPLNDLEVLNLCTLKAGYLHYILRLLAPGSRPLSMSIAPMTHGGRFGKIVEEFSERSNVTRLFVKYAGSGIWGPLPQSLRRSLEVLVVDNCPYFPDEEDPDIILTDTDNSTSHELNMRPKLRTMHVLATSLYPELLAKALASYPIEELWLSECNIQTETRRRKSYGNTGLTSIDEFADLMRETIQTVRVVDNYASDPASRWPCIV